MSDLLIQTIRKLSEAFEATEARALARRVLQEGPFGLTPNRVFTCKDSDLSADKQVLLQDILMRLCKNEPLQYVLGFEWFCDRRFAVGPGVLIPRPETEDLVAWIAADADGKSGWKVLDACTGSGCIAVSLALKLQAATVYGLDISADALAYAHRNAKENNASVHWIEGDLAACELPSDLDVLVSNPPYIAESERKEMEACVLDYEPSLALFVPDANPLYFYALLADAGQRALRNGGALYVEINRRFGKEVCELFAQKGYGEISLRADRYGEPRMIKAIKMNLNLESLTV